MSLAFSPDGRTLATSTGDDTVCLWNLAGDPSIAATVRTPLDGGGRSRSLCFSPDGSTLASWQAGFVRLHDLATGQRRSSGYAPLCLALLPRADGFAFVQGDALSIWDASGFRCGLTAQRSCDPRASMITRGFGLGTVSVSGSRLAVLSFEYGRPIPATVGSVTIFETNPLPPSLTDPPRGAWVRREPFSESPRPAWIGRCEWEQRPSLASNSFAFPATIRPGPVPIALTADASAVLIADDEGRTVRLVELATGTQRSAWRWHGNAVRSLAVSPDGLTAAAGDVMGRVVLWDLA